MPTVVALPDAFAGYNGQSLYQPNWQGVLANDTSDPNTSLSVTAVNGQSANVGTPIVLASGSSLLLHGDGSFIYTPAVDFYGLDVFDYTASDGANSDTTTVEISSIEITITPVANQSHIESDAISLPVSASASSGPAVPFTYAASNLPTGLSIDADTGLISGTIAYGAVGTWPVTVYATAQNGSAATVQQGFTWTVAPVEITVAEIANQSYIESDAVSLQVSASVSHGPTIDYTYSASNLPTGLSIDADTGLISGTISYGTVGSWPVTVFAHPQNGSPAVGQYAFTWTVAPVEITIAEIAHQAHIESDAVSLQVSASVSHGPAIDYTYSASNLPTGLSIDTDTGLISGSIAYGAVGTWPVTVFAYPQNGSPAVGQYAFTWAVAPVEITIAEIVNQSHIESDAISLQVSSSVSHGPAINYTYSASNLPTGLSIDAVTGVISGTISYGAVGTWPVAVFAYPENGSPAVGQYSFTWAVAPVEITIAEIADQSNLEGESVSLQVAASVSHGPAIDYVYSVSNLPTGLSIDTNTGLISGTISDSAVGTWPVTVFAYPQNGSPAFGYTELSWTVAPLPILVAQIADQSNLQGESVALQVVVTDASGMPLNGAVEYRADDLPTGLSINSTTGLISGTIDPNTTDSAVTVTATVGTFSSTRSFFWQIDSPIAFGLAENQYAREGDTISFSMTVTTPGTAPLSYSATGLPSGLTIDGATGHISGEINPESSGGTPSHVVITATDGIYTGSQWFLWTIGPRVSTATIVDQIHTEGDVISLQVEATNFRSGLLTFSATDLPAGLIIDSTGLITGTLSPGSATGLTPKSVVVTVANGVYSSTQTFRWAVNGRITSSNLEGISDTYRVGMEGELFIAEGAENGLLANDESLDEEYPELSIVAINGSTASLGQSILLPSGATLAANALGGFIYHAAVGYTGIDTFTYTLSNGLASLSIPVFILVAPADVEIDLSSAATAVSTDEDDKILVNNLVGNYQRAVNRGDKPYLTQASYNILAHLWFDKGFRNAHEGVFNGMIRRNEKAFAEGVKAVFANRVTPPTPITYLSPQATAKAIRDLDDDDFNTREAAETALENASILVLEAMRAALKEPGITPNKANHLRMLIESAESTLLQDQTMAQFMLDHVEELLQYQAVDIRKLLAPSTTGNWASLRTYAANYLWLRDEYRWVLGFLSEFRGSRPF